MSGGMFEGRRVVIYLRISKDPLGEMRGVKRQRKTARRVVLGDGGVIVEVIVENDTSAFAKRRVRLPNGDGSYREAWRVVRDEWERALRMVREGVADTLLVVDLDRMVRDPRDLEDAVELVEHFGAMVLDLSGALDLSTDHGVMIARQMTAHANQSSRDTSRRIKAQKLADAQAGKANMGTRAFGYKPGGLKVRKGEAALVREACERLLSGASAYSIVADWNARGLRTVRGNPWSPSALRTVVTNPRVAGYRSCNSWSPGATAGQRSAKKSAGESGSGSAAGVAGRQDGAVLEGGVDPAKKWFGPWAVVLGPDGRKVKGKWPPILEKGTWLAVCTLYADRMESVGGRNTRRHLLSGIARCGQCGGKMVGGTVKPGKFMYRCMGRDRGRCGGVARIGPLVDAHVVGVALGKWEEEMAARKAAPQSFADPEPQAWPGAGELELTESRMRETYAGWKAGTLPGVDYFAIRADLERDASRLRRELAVWTAARARLEPPPGPVDLRAAWDRPAEDGGLTLEAKRDFLHRMFIAVEIHPQPIVNPVTGGRSRRWNPDLIVFRWREGGNPEVAA